MGKTSKKRPRAGLLGRHVYALSQLQHSLAARLERELAAEGISLRTHQVLACIDDQGGGSQQQVSDSLEVDRSEMVRIIDRMEKAGMLMREADPADRRRHRLRLTPTGRRALHRGDQLIQSVTEQALSRLSESERDTLHTLALRALGQLVEEQG